MIIWSYNPIDVEIKMFELIAEAINEPIVNYYECQMSAERQSCNYGDSNLSLEFRHIESKSQAMEIFINSKGETHFLSGMLHFNSELLKAYKASGNKNSVYIISERYNPFGKPIVKIIKQMYRAITFRMMALQYRNTITGFFTYGRKGYDYYKKCGFNEDKIYPLVYATNPREVDIINKEKRNNNECQFVYVGRLEFDLKGVDILIDALERVKERKKEGWHIDFIGGYGIAKDSVYTWVSNNQQYASISKPIPADDIITRLAEYDVCLIPSRREGYHTLPAQCIAAGIACIATDGCNSDELVQRSKSGIVIKSNSVMELEKAMLMCLEDPEMVRKFKNNTKAFRHFIDTPSIATFFVECMKHSEGQTEYKPIPPWN